MLNVSDSGVYQCAAENKHQTIYANAELRVLGKAFVYNHEIQNEIEQAVTRQNLSPALL